MTSIFDFHYNTVVSGYTTLRAIPSLVNELALNEFRARGADFQVGGLTRTRKREPTRRVRGHAPPRFEILFF